MESGSKRLTAREKRVISVQRQVEEMYLSIAMLMSNIPATAKDGIAVATQIIPISESYKSLCETNDTFLEWMERMLGYSGILGLITAHAVLGGMIAMNHGFNPLSFIGFKMPEKPKEQQEPEFSEEQRAMIWLGLMQRQEQMKAQLNEGNNP